MAEEKIYMVKRKWDTKYYSSFDYVKKHSSPTDKIIEYTPNGESYTLDDYKKELERDRDLKKLLNDENDTSYPNIHHLHILDVIKTYYDSNPHWDYTINKNFNKILTEKDFLRYIKNNKLCLLNFACKSVEDYQHILSVMNYRFMRDGSNPRHGRYYYTDKQKQQDEERYKNAVNPDRKKQFNQAKENIKKKKEESKKLKVKS